MWPLRHNTAGQKVELGPFLDATNGNDQEAALTIANTDIRLFKAGASASVAKNAGGATHTDAGNYSATLDATDTNTLGPMKIRVHVTGALYVELLCEVLPAIVYDSKYSANGPRPLYGIIADGQAQQVTATSLRMPATFSAPADVLIGSLLFVYSSTNGLFEGAIVRDYDNATKDVIIDGWIAEQPSGTIMFVMYRAVGQSASDLAAFITGNTGKSWGDAHAQSVAKLIAVNAASGGLDAAGIRAAVGLGAANLDTQLSGVDTKATAIKAKTDNLPADPADASDVAAGIAAAQAALESDIAAVQTQVDKIGTPAGASLSADILAVKNQTAAIETDTQNIQTRLPTALSEDGEMRSDVKRINRTVIIGNGTTVPFGPA